MAGDPIQLGASELFYDDCEQAQKLWDMGFRPIHAEDVQPGQEVAYWVTDVFRMGGQGSFNFARVYKVEIDPRWGGVTIDSSAHTGPAECDDGQEVWVRDPEPGTW